MRILNVAQTYFPYVAEGGRPAKVRALSRKLAEHGHSVTVLSANLGLSEWSSVACSIQKTAMGLQFTENGVVTIYLPTLARYRVLTINPRVIRFCRVHLSQFDLVHFYGIYDLLGPIISHYSRRRRNSLRDRADGNVPDQSIAALTMKKMWHRTIGGEFCRNAARVIATSELEQAELVEAGVPREKIAIRHNGIDSDLSPACHARGRFRCPMGNVERTSHLSYFLSRLIPRKGADLLIEAFAQASPISGRLVIAGPEGEPGYRARLEACARKSGVGARVLFAGPVYDEEKSSLFADAEFLLFRRGMRISQMSLRKLSRAVFL